jgi:2-hydroxy-3-oxopropionate reductase
MKEKIGFIGLGIMGGPMATNLINAGYKIKVFDIRAEAVNSIINLGAEESSSAAHASSGVDVVITMLPDSPDVELVYLGPKGVLEGADPETVLVDMSTIAPQAAINVAQAAGGKGCPMLDAPVSGGDVGAREGKLSIMVGGDAQYFKRMLAIFSVLGTATHCGGNGAGQIVKACNQIQVALNFIGMSEALVLGTKAGVDPAIIVKVLSAGYAQSRVMDVRGPRVIERDFEPGFKSKFHFKDLNIIRETGRSYNVPLPAAALAYELFNTMIAKGRGELDHSGVVTIIEDLAEVEVRKKD